MTIDEIVKELEENFEIEDDDGYGCTSVPFDIDEVKHSKKVGVNLRNWLKEKLTEYGKQREKEIYISILKKNVKIDEAIFENQDTCWKELKLYSNEARCASNALDEINTFCEQKLKELEGE